jgi:hypothetical protein
MRNQALFRQERLAEGVATRELTQISLACHIKSINSIFSFFCLWVLVTDTIKNTYKNVVLRILYYVS